VYDKLGVSTCTAAVTRYFGIQEGTESAAADRR
jgi:hypothetical protein